MNSSLAVERTVLVSALHQPRTLHRIITKVAGRGFVVDDLRYRTSPCSERALVTMQLDRRFANRSLDDLCRVVAGAPDILWAKSLASAISEKVPHGVFELDRFEVSTRMRRPGRHLNEAMVAAFIGGTRHLAAGEGAEPVAALIGAFVALLRPALRSAPLELSVTNQWSTSSTDSQAFAVASGARPGFRCELARVGPDELTAAADALAGVVGLALAARQGAGSRGLGLI